MWSLTKIVFIAIGLYLVIVNLYDMIRDPAPMNIGYQAVSVAIGGGLLSYAFNFTPITSTLDAIVGGAKDAIIEVLKTTASATAKLSKDAGKGNSS